MLLSLLLKSLDGLKLRGTMRADVLLRSVKLQRFCSCSLLLIEYEMIGRGMLSSSFALRNSLS
jgi:hypothetical protein